ncbi:MAG: 4-hydroxybenzoate octaprenyltransferase [Candidatus Omnitrophica bacterium]|nr:4-hydroxybenzoate octaprenyltransferase [Candidatus Omnitrophota bacterium]
MIKFEHSIFALPFAYTGLLLAEKGFPSLRLFFLITIAMVSFRTMAMGLNRLIDHSIDARNPRTKNRALPAGKLRRSYVITWTVASFVLFELVTYKINPLCFKLSPIPFFLALLYPFTKRFTWMSHWILGMVLGIAPYGAWLASRAVFSWVPGFISLGVIFWVAGFDIIYALQDEKFDRCSKLQSFPAKFGPKASLITTRALHFLTIWMWMFAGWSGNLGVVYFLGIACAAIFLIREHFLIELHGLEKMDEAFFWMNAVISCSMLAAVLLEIGIRSITA